MGGEGTKSLTQSFVSPVTPSRLFKAFILDSHNILPELMFSSIKSLEFIEGDGDVGSIEQLHYIEGDETKYRKHRIDVLDKERFICKYRFIEGDGYIDEMLESHVCEVKFEGFGEGGACVCKFTTEYKTKPSIEINGIDLELYKGKPLGVFQVVEAYLKTNPQLYA